MVGAARCLCADSMFRPRIPVNTTGTIASPADLSCHLRRWRVQRNAGVTRHPPEPYPESAAIVRCVLHEAFAPLVCREP
jgi:hypothetical protein